MQRARALGLDEVYDYRTTDFSKLGWQFDVVYDTAATMRPAVGFSLLRDKGVFLDLDPTPGKFLRALVNRRFKLVICSATADVLDRVARAAGDGRLRLPIAEIVQLNDAARLIADLEGGKKIGGKGLIAMESV